MSSNSMGEKETICGLCSKSYNDPRILPCLHSFCKQCLHHEIEASGSQPVFKCPTCARRVTIPVGGASGLTQNFHLGFEAEVAGYTSKLVSNGEVCCDECMEGSVKERNGYAEVFCCTCRKFLCKSCHNYHKRSRHLSKHIMVGLDQEGAKQLQSTMKPKECYCSQPNHGDNKLIFYCETCKVLVCRDCTSVTHNGHGVTELSTVAKMQRNTMEDVLTKRNRLVTMLTDVISKNTEMMEEVKTTKENCLVAINQAIETLQQTLLERKKALLFELETVSLSSTTALTIEKEQLEKMLEDINRCTELTSHILQTHTDHEVVAVGELVSTELKATTKRIEAISFRYRNISFDFQSDGLVRELSNLGCIMDLSPSPSSSTWTSTSVAMVGTRFVAKVESKISKGAGYPHGGLKVQAEMRSKDHNGAVVYGEVEDHRDGTYTITLTPQITGPHQLLISMDGQHVQNSPHDLQVMSKHDYSTLHKVQPVVYCRGHPLCVAIHDSGDIYVGSSASSIYVFDQTGQLKSTIAGHSGGLGQGTQPGSINGQFSVPTDLCIKGDMLYIADNGNHCIQKLTLVGRNPQPVSAYQLPQVSTPQALGGNSTSLGSGSDWLASLQQQPRQQRSFGSGFAPFQQQPSLQIQGRIPPSIGQASTAASLNQQPSTASLNSITAVIVDEYNRVIASDDSTNKIHIFSHNGEIIKVIDGNVTGDNSILHPVGLTLDPYGNIHVAAYGSNVIKVFTKDGIYVRIYGRDLKGPRGIAIDDEGYCIVSESEGNCLSIFDPQGNKIHTVAMPELCRPCGLALDPKDGSVYVASNTVDIVLKFSK